MLVAVWVACGVFGVLLLVVPTLNLWRTVKALGREVGRVSDSLLAATEGLDNATRNLPTRQNAADDVWRRR